MKRFDDDDWLRVLLDALEAIIRASREDQWTISEAYTSASDILSLGEKHGSEHLETAMTCCATAFQKLQKSNDIAAIGWILAAVQRRASMRDLDNWEKLSEIADIAVWTLPTHKKVSLH